MEYLQNLITQPHKIEITLQSDCVHFGYFLISSGCICLATRSKDRGNKANPNLCAFCGAVCEIMKKSISLLLKTRRFAKDHDYQKIIKSLTFLQDNQRLFIIFWNGSENHKERKARREK